MADIYKQIISIMREIDAIGKDKKNVSQGYSFRGIDELYNALHPVMAKHGVFVQCGLVNGYQTQLQKGVSSINDYKITFYAEDGSSVSSLIRGEAIDYGDKGCNKTVSAAMKYALMTTFLIPTEDIEDADAETPIATKPEPPKLKPLTQEQYDIYCIKLTACETLKQTNDIGAELTGYTMKAEWSAHLKGLINTNKLIFEVVK